MGNQYGVSPLDVLELLGPMFVIGPLLIWLVVIGPLFVYPLARWKLNRDGAIDPQLGLKVALHYFALIAFQLVLVAAALTLFALFSKAVNRGDLYRTSFGLLIPAGGILAAHLVLLGRTNQRDYPVVRRLFLGYNVMITGLVGFATLLFAFQVLFRKGSAGEAGRFAIASVLVYAGAWAACGVQFGRLVLGTPVGPASASPASGPPPGPPGPPAPSPQSPRSPQSTKPSGPTLPPLGTGTYPPIEEP